MKQYQKRGPALAVALALLLGLLSACEKAPESVMHLTRTEGRVTVLDGEGRSVEPAEGLELYSGYEVETRAEGRAWMDLDGERRTKLDQDSEVEITKEDKRLELKVKSGRLLFHIARPLEDGEDIDVRASSVTAALQEACGWVEVPEDGAPVRVYLLEGRIRCSSEDERETVRAGEAAAVTEDGEITVEPFTPREIPAFVLEEIEDDDDLLESILDDTGFDLPAIDDGPEDPDSEDGTPEAPDIARWGSVPMISNGASAALRQDGTLWMWGYGAWGNNSGGAFTARTRYNLPDGGPAPVMEDVAAICFNAPRIGGSDVPDFFGGAIKKDGSLWMWGDGVWSWDSDSDAPVHIMDGVAAVSMGYWTCAILKNDGTLWVIGDNSYPRSLNPVQVMDGVASVGASDSTLAVIKTDRTLWTMEPDGGDPKQVMDDAAAVSVSSSTVAVIKGDGSLWMWGDNAYGQIGNGYQGDQTTVSEYLDEDTYETGGSIETPMQTTPVKVLDHVKAVSAAHAATAAVLEDGSLWVWGESELNVSTNADVDVVQFSYIPYLRHAAVQTVPQKVMDGVAAVALGSEDLVLKEDGTLLQSTWDSGLVQVLDGVALPGAAGESGQGKVLVPLPREEAQPPASEAVNAPASGAANAPANGTANAPANGAGNVSVNGAAGSSGSGAGGSPISGTNGFPTNADGDIEIRGPKRIEGDIIVQSGQNVSIISTPVNGRVEVSGGGNVTIVSSSIGGEVRVTGGGNLSLTSSSIGGNVHVSGNGNVNLTSSSVGGGVQISGSGNGVITSSSVGGVLDATGGGEVSIRMSTINGQWYE